MVIGVNLSAVCPPVHVAGALIIEEPGLHVDMYYRVIPSQIIMLYATMPIMWNTFVMSLFNNNTAFVKLGVVGLSKHCQLSLKFR